MGSKMNKSDYVASIVSDIELFSEELNIAPRLLTYNDYMRMSVEYRPTVDRKTVAVILREAGGFANIRDAHFKPVVTEAEVKMKAAARDNKKLAKEEATENIFLTRFKELSEKLYKNPIIIPKTAFPKAKKIDRNLHLLISDTHFGAKLDGREGVSEYGHVEEARRLAQVILQTADYKPQYRNETKLFININGDIIQGQLHDARDGEPLAEQAATAIYLLNQAIGFLATKFPQIEVNCATGNHDRNTSRHKDRATLQKWDSIATIIYFGVKQSVAKLPNVKVNIPRTPWVSYNSFGVNYYGTHGDTHFRVPNPGSSINVSMLENQINKLNSSLTDKEEYKVVFIGHIHAGMLIRLSNGVTLVTNPPLIPVDSFAKSIGIFEAPTGQWLWESVPGHPFGDSRYLTVDHNTDKDQSLDKIIKPFIDF